MFLYIYNIMTHYIMNTGILKVFSRVAQQELKKKTLGEHYS